MNKTIRAIAQIRVKNNENWMKILDLAFKSKPNEAKKIMGEIVKLDKEVTRLCQQLERE